MIQHTLSTPYPVGPVHCYTFETDGGVIMFDTGPRTLEAMAYARKQLPLESITHLFVTHCHIDHYGQIDFFEKETDAEIFISKYDATMFEQMDKRLEVMRDILADFGFPLAVRDRVEQTIVEMKKSVPFPKNYRILEDSHDELKKLNLSYLACPGHSQSDIVYLYDGYAVSGDVLLRDTFTTPLLDMDFDHMAGRYNNYRAYCETIGQLKSIDQMTFLPGHYVGIDSVDDRIVYYVSKLLERTLRLKPAIETLSVYGVLMSIMADPIANPMTAYLKTSEIVFMKDLLAEPERLFDTLEKVGLNHHFEKDLKQLKK